MIRPPPDCTPAHSARTSSAHAALSALTASCAWARFISAAVVAPMIITFTDCLIRDLDVWQWILFTRHPLEYTGLGSTEVDDGKPNRTDSYRLPAE